MKKILWMSRHKPHPRQIETFREMYSKDVVLKQESRPFYDARVVARRFREGGFDDMVIVAPLPVIAVLCNERLKMLNSEAIEKNDPVKIEFRGARGQRATVSCDFDALNGSLSSSRTNSHYRVYGILQIKKFKLFEAVFDKSKVTPKSTPSKKSARPCKGAVEGECGGGENSAVPEPEVPLQSEARCEIKSTHDLFIQNRAEQKLFFPSKEIFLTGRIGNCKNNFLRGAPSCGTAAGRSD